jgi:CRP/FNR family transcriptional regulator, cyclic AMP receptor protein
VERRERALGSRRTWPAAHTAITPGTLLALTVTASPNPPSKFDRLTAVPMLSALSKEQLEKLVDMGEDRTFHAGETIVRQGEKEVGLYLILSGSADVRRAGQKISTLSAGQFFGEAALLVDEPRTADVFATTEVNCFVVNRWDFWTAVGVDPEVNRALYEETVKRLRAFQSKVAE